MLDLEDATDDVEDLQAEDDRNSIKVAVLGKPNTGKIQRSLRSIPMYRGI